MSDLEDNIGVVQKWLTDLTTNVPADPPGFSTSKTILTEIVNLIQNTPRESLTRDLSETYADLEKQIHDQGEALTQATIALKAQITHREVAVQSLRKAYNDLETHLGEHLVDHSRLSQRLRDQVNEYHRLQALEREQRMLTEALRDTLATMSTTLDLDKILDHILDTVGRVTPYDGANVILVESDLVQVVRQRGYAQEGSDGGWLNQRIPVTRLAILQQLMEIGKPMAIPDTSSSSMWIGFPGLQWVNSNVIAPIRSNGKILGFLSLDSATRGYFTQVHAERLQTFADQAAIAIQNARLLDRAKLAAVMAERNRIANELHDTISQTLWSMSLITERLPVIWESDREEGQHSLVTLHQLAQSALVEMRSLLMELQPESLTKVKMGDLIHQLADIIAARKALEISVDIDAQAPVPNDVHVAVYRVVQETLNNIALHASATRADIVYSSRNGHLELTIKDNGTGFNPDAIGPGHLGLSIMKDRVQTIGGTIRIESIPGEGTTITVTWQAPPE